MIIEEIVRVMVIICSLILMICTVIGVKASREWWENDEPDKCALSLLISLLVLLLAVMLAWIALFVDFC